MIGTTLVLCQFNGDNGGVDATLPFSKSSVSASDAINSDFGVGSTGGTTAMKDDKASLMSELDERSIIGWVSEDISVTIGMK